MSTIKSVTEVLADRTPTNSQSASNEVKPIDNSTMVDRALELTQDLYDTEYKKWFAKQAIRIGADRYLGLAKDAREGRSPRKLFVWMLKRV
ncbi:MAG: hypothetical protein ABIR46_03060 [Candidatus Saccharimonadales bacterium]